MVSSLATGSAFPTNPLHHRFFPRATQYLVREKAAAGNLRDPPTFLILPFA